MFYLLFSCFLQLNGNFVHGQMSPEHRDWVPLSLVFICRENPRGSGILLFPDSPRFYRLMKTRNRRYPRSSGVNWDKSGESGAFIFSRRVPDFCDGRRSFLTYENLNCCAPVPPSQINMASLEHLGQASGEYPINRQNLGWLAKSKIPDNLEFSRHMKTRLYEQLTYEASIEFHPHGHMSVPAPWYNSDVPHSYWCTEYVGYHCVSVSVSSKVLSTRKKNNMTISA